MSAGSLDEEQQEEIGPIQGYNPDSREEWRVAQALYRLGHEFIYQFALFGRRGVKGEVFIDFLVVTTIPRPTPLEVYSRYWHEGEKGSGDRFRELVIDSVTRGNFMPLQEIWAREAQSVDMAYDTLKYKIGVA